MERFSLSVGEPNIGEYIEHEGFGWGLFRVDSYDWRKRLWTNAPFGEVYLKHEYLLVSCPLFELPESCPILVTGGYGDAVKTDNS